MDFKLIKVTCYWNNQYKILYLFLVEVYSVWPGSRCWLDGLISRDNSLIGCCIVAFSTWFYLCNGIMGPKRVFMRYPIGASLCMCIDMGDNEGVLNLNPTAHQYLTSCYVDCTMYAYIKVNCFTYFRGCNMLSAFKNIMLQWLFAQCRFCVGVTHRWPSMLADPRPYIHSWYLCHGFQATRLT